MRLVALAATLLIASCVKQEQAPITEATQSSEIVVAAGNGDLDRVRQLLANGASPNEQECADPIAIEGRSCQELGWTPLMIASGHGHIAIVELLLRAGADPSSMDNANHSALWYAQQGGYREIEQMLLAARKGR